MQLKRGTALHASSCRLMRSLHPTCWTALVIPCGFNAPSTSILDKWFVDHEHHSNLFIHSNTGRKNTDYRLSISCTHSLRNQCAPLSVMVKLVTNTHDHWRQLNAILSEGILVLCDNARPHMAATTRHHLEMEISDLTTSPIQPWSRAPMCLDLLRRRRFESESLTRSKKQCVPG